MDEGAKASSRTGGPAAAQWLSATGPADLRARLAASVAQDRADQARTKEALQRLMTALLLATLADELTFPLAVQERDKPDMGIELPARRIGLECVEARPPDWAWITSVRDTEYPDQVIFLQSFAPGPKQLTKPQAREVARGDVAGPPWMSGEAEEQWSVAIEYFIRNKTEKLRAGYYAEFSCCWLVVCDRWPLPFVRGESLRVAADLCRAKLDDLLVPPSFGRIFVVTPEACVEFGPGEPSIRPLHRL